MTSKSQNYSESKRNKLIELIQEHQRIKKNFEIQDAYKLIYQSVFGIGHIIVNPELAQKYLRQELDSVLASNNETLIEKISISGEIVRLNLRPYKYRNGSIDRLFQAMLQSAGEIAGNREGFLARWGDFKQAVMLGELDFNKQELKIFDDKVQSENFPAIHHSAAYKEANQPAYRVLKNDLARKLL
jgi:hypothetical protein